MDSTSMVEGGDRSQCLGDNKGFSSGRDQAPSVGTPRSLG